MSKWSPHSGHYCLEPPSSLSSALLQIIVGETPVALVPPRHWCGAVLISSGEPSLPFFGKAVGVLLPDVSPAPLS